MFNLVLYGKHLMNKQLNQLDAHQKVYWDCETVQVMDISARQSRNNWGTLISISGQGSLVKGLTYDLALCTGMNIHGLSVSLHKPNYLEIKDIWEMKTTKKKRH